MAKTNATNNNFRRATRMIVGGSAPASSGVGPRATTTARKTARSTGSQLQPNQANDSEDDDDNDDEVESPRGIPARRGRRLIRQTEVTQQDRFPTISPGSKSDRTLAAATPARQLRQRIVLGELSGGARGAGERSASAATEDSGGVNNASPTQRYKAARRLPRAAVPDSDGEDEVDAPQPRRTRQITPATAPALVGARKSAPSSGPGMMRGAGVGQGHGQRRHR